MNRFLIFGFSHYYPGGGMNDLRFKTNELSKAKEYVHKWATVDKGYHCENLHVYDLEENRIIYEAEFDVHDYMEKDARTLDVKTGFCY